MHAGGMQKVGSRHDDGLSALLAVLPPWPHELGCGNTLKIALFEIELKRFNLVFLFL